MLTFIAALLWATSAVLFSVNFAFAWRSRAPARQLFFFGAMAVLTATLAALHWVLLW
ncbi:hypothetical protein GGQ64_005382 [Rhizobium azooxidifex]|uniref:Uncharacterized protein n=1 Tax=Mycoplana azooxidifex TaxID=1636188 RepID=A0A7W6GLV5_9HYPH|nr:hypothetical protein [Mycoplana azooxidifex]MBB3980135.1 hypothetical protein [Mycoplana azooxidifex]